MPYISLAEVNGGKALDINQNPEDVVTIVYNWGSYHGEGIPTSNNNPEKDSAELKQILAEMDAMTKSIEWKK